MQNYQARGRRRKQNNKRHDVLQRSIDADKKKVFSVLIRSSSLDDPGSAELQISAGPRQFSLNCIRSSKISRFKPSFQSSYYNFRSSELLQGFRNVIRHSSQSDGENEERKSEDEYENYAHYEEHRRHDNNDGELSNIQEASRSNSYSDPNNPSRVSFPQNNHQSQYLSSLMDSPILENYNYMDPMRSIGSENVREESKEEESNEEQKADQEANVPNDQNQQQQINLLPNLNFLNEFPGLFLPHELQEGSALRDSLFHRDDAVENLEDNIILLDIIARHMYQRIHAQLNDVLGQNSHFYNNELEQNLLEELANQEEEGNQRRLQMEEQVVFNFDALEYGNLEIVEGTLVVPSQMQNNNNRYQLRRFNNSDPRNHQNAVAINDLPLEPFPGSQNSLNVNREDVENGGGSSGNGAGQNANASVANNQSNNNNNNGNIINQNGAPINNNDGMNGNGNGNGSENSDSRRNRQLEERKDGAGNAGQGSEEYKEGSNYSDETIMSDIPGEEMQTFGNEVREHDRHYNFFEDNFLLMKAVQWQKDSHGLFDYEMRQIIQSNFRVLSSKIVLRKGQLIKFEDPSVDIKAKYGNDFQVLFKIEKIRNKYFIEGVTPRDPKEDIDNNYLENGEPTLPPFEMKERMYNVIRYLKQNSTKNKQDYLLKKNDIIKVGRVKLKVSTNFNSEKITLREKKAARKNKKLNNKHEEGQIIEIKPVSKQSLGSSDKSNYEPQVGEINYVEAKIPVIVKKSVAKSTMEPEPAAPKSLSLSAKNLQPDLSLLRNIGIQVEEESKQIQQAESLELEPNMNTPNKVEKPVEQGTQTEFNNEKLVSERDRTSNARFHQEEEKKQEIIVQPSSILQQIQREIMGNQEINLSNQNNVKIMQQSLKIEQNSKNIIALNKLPDEMSSSSESSSSQESNSEELDALQKLVKKARREEKQKRRAEKLERNKLREEARKQEQEESKQNQKKHDEAAASSPSSHQASVKESNQQSSQSENLPQCRLCWETEFDEDNPLLQICQCRGGVEFIHYDCIRTWLKTKEYRQVTTHYTSIYWRQFQCEICKQALPYVFRNQGRKYSLIQTPDVLDGNHLILESVSLENKHSRMVHILHPKPQDIGGFRGRYLLGRGQDCDLKVSDITVSRNHCTINYKNGKFYLQDTNSKFGTLALSKGRVEILPDTNTGMQIGRTLMVFQTRPINRQAFLVGDYLQEKNDMGRSNHIQERKNVNEQRARDKGENKKHITDEKFNFEAYIEEMEEDYNREERMQQQLMEHEWKMKIQNDVGFIQEQQRIEAEIFAKNQSREDGIIRPRDVWKNALKSEKREIVQQEEEKKEIVIRRPQSQIMQEGYENDSADRQQNDFMNQQRIAEQLVKATEEQVRKIKEKMGISEELKKLEEEEKAKRQSDMERRQQELIRRDEQIQKKKEDHIKQFGEGRILISRKEQANFKEALIAREKGSINGNNEAPVKVAISKNFADQKKKEENIEGLKRQIQRIKEEEKGQEVAGQQDRKMREDSKQAEEDIASFEDLERRHQELMHSQSQIHRGLEDIWRMQLNRQRENAERLENEEKERKRRNNNVNENEEEKQ